MNDMEKECYNCAARFECGTMVSYGSIICMANRMRSGQTKGDLISKEKNNNVGFCAYCGRPLKNNGYNKYCTNVNCVNRFENV